MDIKKLIDKLHPLERKVLPVIEKPKPFEEIVEQTKLQEVEVMRALQWLANKNIVTIQKINQLFSRFRGLSKQPRSTNFFKNLLWVHYSTS